MSIAGRQVLASVKASADTGGPALVLRVNGYPGYCLRPVAARPGRLDAVDVTCLTAWRNRHVKSFLTEFQATEARTARWLENSVHGNDSKVLFMVDGPDARPVGYMGLAYIDWDRGYGEADAIVRGEPAPRGLMSAALRVLLAWARSGLGLSTLGVRVLSDNDALVFYQRLGFKPIRQVPLLPRQDADGLSWEETPGAAAERHLVHHVLEQS